MIGLPEGLFATKPTAGTNLLPLGQMNPQEANVNIEGDQSKLSFIGMLFQLISPSTQQVRPIEMLEVPEANAEVVQTSSLPSSEATPQLAARGEAIFNHVSIPSALQNRASQSDVSQPLNMIAPSTKSAKLVSGVALDEKDRADRVSLKPGGFPIDWKLPEEAEASPDETVPLGVSLKNKLEPLNIAGPALGQQEGEESTFVGQPKREVAVLDVLPATSEGSERIDAETLLQNPVSENIPIRGAKAPPKHRVERVDTEPIAEPMANRAESDFAGRNEASKKLTLDTPTGSRVDYLTPQVVKMQNSGDQNFRAEMNAGKEEIPKSGQLTFKFSPGQAQHLHVQSFSSPKTRNDVDELTTQEQPMLHRNREATTKQGENNSSAPRVPVSNGRDLEITSSGELRTIIERKSPEVEVRMKSVPVRELPLRDSMNDGIFAAQPDVSQPEESTWQNPPSGKLPNNAAHLPSRHSSEIPDKKPVAKLMATPAETETARGVEANVMSTLDAPTRTGPDQFARKALEWGELLIDWKRPASASELNSFSRPDILEATRELGILAREFAAPFSGWGASVGSSEIMDSYQHELENPVNVPIELQKVGDENAGAEMGTGKEETPKSGHSQQLQGQSVSHQNSQNDTVKPATPDLTQPLVQKNHEVHAKPVENNAPMPRVPEDFARNLVVKISDELRAHIEGKASEVRVRMKPESMGELSLRVSMEDGKLSARMDVSQPTVKAALESQLPQLRSALLSQGIDVQRFDIVSGSEMQFEHSREGHAFQQRPHQAKRRMDEDVAESYAAARSLGYNTVEYII